MKRDKIFVIFIVFTAFAVTGVLQYMRSPGTSQNVPYLSALESSINVFGEGSTNEFYSQLNSDLENSIPVEYFVEELRIIEKFTNQKQIKPVLCRYEPTDYISFYISLTDNINLYGNAHKLKMSEVNTYDTIFSVGYQGIRTVNNNRRITHKIKANDSLYKLAKRYYNDGSKWENIYQANKNKMPDPHSLKIGQELLIPNITVSSNEERIKIIKT